MKKLYLAIIFLTALSVQKSAAQYFPKQGIHVLQWGEAAHGMIYRTNIEFPANYNKENLDSIVTALAPDLFRHNANVIRIIHRSYGTIKIGKKPKKHKHYVEEGFEAELFFTTNVEQLQPIPYRQYDDSLKNTLIGDTSKEALLVIYPSPQLQGADPFPVIATWFQGLNKCELNNPYSICSYVVTQEMPLHFNRGLDAQFTINIKFGQVYFLQYLPTKVGEFHPADFLFSYRYCKELQKINDEIQMYKE